MKIILISMVFCILYILMPHPARAAVDCERADSIIEKANNLFFSNPSKVLELYMQAVELCPNSANAHYNLGFARYVKNDIQGASISFEEALRISPDFVEAMNGLARAYLSMGRIKDARELTEKAIRLKPDDETVKTTLTLMKEKTSPISMDVKEHTQKDGLRNEIAEKVHTIPNVNVKERKNAYAVIIGIENYRDIPKVEFAVNDAKWFREYLVKLAGVPEENIVTLYNERAGRVDIAKYVEVWLKNNITKEDASVYVYYAGHGSPDVSTRKAYIVPYDGDPVYIDRTGYSLEDLYASLNKLPAKEIIVALDSCFSGAGGRSVVAQGTRPIIVSVENPVLSGGKTVVFAASRENQISSFYPEAGHGLFTYYMLLGLKGEADADKNGWVDIKELYEYVTPNVSKTARRMNREQNPTLLPSPEILGERLKIKLPFSISK